MSPIDRAKFARREALESDALAVYMAAQKESYDAYVSAMLLINALFAPESTEAK